MIIVNDYCIYNTSMVCVPVCNEFYLPGSRGVGGTDTTCVGSFGTPYRCVNGYSCILPVSS